MNDGIAKDGHLSHASKVVKPGRTFLACRGGGDGFLFRYENSVPLTSEVRRPQFPHRGGNHGGKQGVPETTIKALGRWKSDAYMGYIRTSREQLADVSRELAK